jgi:hypothetical protein
MANPQICSASQPFSSLTTRLSICLSPFGPPFSSSPSIQPSFKKSSGISGLSIVSQRDWPFRLPKTWSSCERWFQSSSRSSVVPLMPPVAVCSMSMCVWPASSVYCLQCRVMVAKAMALRVIQLMPWRARTASVSSERVLFYIVLVGCW